MIFEFDRNQKKYLFDHRANDLADPVFSFPMIPLYSSNIDVGSLERLEEKIVSDLINDQSYKNVLVHCIISNINLNNGFLTEGALVDIVRHTGGNHDKFDNPAKFSYQFGLVEDQEVRDNIKRLKAIHFIKDCPINGVGLDYYTLCIDNRKLVNAFLFNFFSSINRPQNGQLSDIEVLDLVQNYNGGTDVDTEIYMEVLKHPYVFCLAGEEMTEFFKQAPKAVKYYINTAAEIETGMKKTMFFEISKNL